VRCLAVGLPDVVRDPRALAPRTLALLGAWLARGIAGRHHDVAAPQGLPRAGRPVQNLPHAATPRHRSCRTWRRSTCPPPPKPRQALTRALKAVDPARRARRTQRALSTRPTPVAAPVDPAGRSRPRPTLPVRRSIPLVRSTPWAVTLTYPPSLAALA